MRDKKEDTTTWWWKVTLESRRKGNRTMDVRSQKWEALDSGIIEFYSYFDDDNGRPSRQTVAIVKKWEFVEKVGYVEEDFPLTETHDDSGGILEKIRNRNCRRKTVTNLPPLVDGGTAGSG
jgi:hypothetical protein